MIHGPKVMTAHQKVSFSSSANAPRVKRHLTMHCRANLHENQAMVSLDGGPVQRERRGVAEAPLPDDLWPL